MVVLFGLTRLRSATTGRRLSHVDPTVSGPSGYLESGQCRAQIMQKLVAFAQAAVTSVLFRDLQIAIQPPDNPSSSGNKEYPNWNHA
jgi:hypothetical protein